MGMLLMLQPTPWRDTCHTCRRLHVCAKLGHSFASERLACDGLTVPRGRMQGTKERESAMPSTWIATLNSMRDYADSKFAVATKCTGKRVDALPNPRRLYLTSMLSRVDKSKPIWKRYPSSRCSPGSRKQQQALLYLFTNVAPRPPLRSRLPSSAARSHSPPTPLPGCGPLQHSSSRAR